MSNTFSPKLSVNQPSVPANKLTRSAIISRINPALHHVTSSSGFRCLRQIDMDALEVRVVVHDDCHHAHVREVPTGVRTHAHAYAHGLFRNYRAYRKDSRGGNKGACSVR